MIDIADTRAVTVRRLGRILHPDGRFDVTGNDGITYTSIPPPDPGRLFNPDRPVRTTDPIRRARENAAIVEALAEVQRAAAGMTTEDHRNVARAKERARALPRRPPPDAEPDAEPNVRQEAPEVQAA